MDNIEGRPGPVPLQPLSSDRANQQRESSLFSSYRTADGGDGDVHDKIRQFNNLAHLHPNNNSLSKQLERKTADAALKRAMLGREEAENETRRYRDEARSLRKQLEEGREREHRVGERLETVMENYGRAKETYAHTQAIWEKEIRRARKETFKSQSTHVKLQEELKAARATAKSAEEVLEREKELSKAREQEAFQARYELVSVQQQLEQALEQVKSIQQERDAFKTLAQSEEVARIAAEGRLPLPQAEEMDVEPASPPKKPRVSLSTVEISSSAASEAEIEELTRMWQWERRRADRAIEHLEFVEFESSLHTCSPAQSRPRRSMTGRSSLRRSRNSIIDPADHMILGTQPESPKQPTPTREATPLREATPAKEATPPREATPPGEATPVREPSPEKEMTPAPEPTPAREQTPDRDQAPVASSPRSPKREATPEDEPQEQPATKKPRRETVFVPDEGTFRTLSQQELDAMEADDEEPTVGPPSPVESNPRHYARTPSVEPPSFALMAKERTSLLSLLHAPHDRGDDGPVINIPTTSGEDMTRCEENEDDEEQEPEAKVEEQEACDKESTESPRRIVEEMPTRPHTTADFYTVTTTTSVPVRDDKIKPRPVTIHVDGQQPSFDVNNPALTPTMSREEALAQIRERRGRARSAAQGAMTPRKQMMAGLGERRDISAPAGRSVMASTTGSTGAGARGSRT